MQLVLGLLFAAIIGIVHFFGEEIDEYLGSNNIFLVSFSAGFTISYFFLTMLPEISQGTRLTGYEFLPALSGFAVFYVLEELIYERESHLDQVKKDFKELHTVFVTAYHLAIGVLLYFLIGRGLEGSLLFFLPVLMHTAVNSMSMKELHEEILERTGVKITVSFSTIIGVILTHTLQFSASSIYQLFGFIGGMFIYVVVHDALNPERERPLGFLTGVIFYLFLVYLI